MEGLGDLIAYILHHGIIGKIVFKLTGKDKPCDKCEERRKKFNKMVAFHKSQKMVEKEP